MPVTDCAMFSSSKPKFAPTRFERGDYFADVLRGGSSAETFWYYLVQRKGSKDVIDLAKFDTYQQAVDAAQEVLRKLNR